MNVEIERQKHQKIKSLKQTLLKIVLFYGTALSEMIFRRVTKVAKPSKNEKIQITDLLDTFLMTTVVTKVKTGN